MYDKVEATTDDISAPLSRLNAASQMQEVVQATVDCLGKLIPYASNVAKLGNVHADNFATHHDGIVRSMRTARDALSKISALEGVLNNVRAELQTNDTELKSTMARLEAQDTYLAITAKSFSDDQAFVKNVIEQVTLAVAARFANDIEASLKFPLPDSDATVCGFSVGADSAIAVAKEVAKAVAYKEREKGRAVATAANVSGAVWETTVFPLPHLVPVEVAIQTVCKLDQAADGSMTLHLPLTFSQPVADITVTSSTEDGSAGEHNLTSGASTMPEGLRITFAAPPAGAVASALHAGSFLWSACVPKATIDAAFAAQPSTGGRPMGQRPESATLTSERRSSS